MTTPQDIIRAWCASCGMAEPSNGDVAALLSLLFPELPSAQWHEPRVLTMSMFASMDDLNTAKRAAQTSQKNAELLVSAYRIAATLQGEQSLVVMELANRFARLAGKSAGEAQ